MGRQIASDLVAEGAEVIAVDLSERPKELDDRERVTYLQFDIANEEQVASAAALAGRLDFVVNAAGICWFDRDGSVTTIDRAVWDRTLQVNLTAAMTVCRHTLPLLAANGRGALVHIASVAGLRVADGPMDAYQVSKAGLISLSRAIALEYGPSGIRSNTVCPGAILTPMIKPLYHEDPERAERMRRRTPLRRLGVTRDVAAACLFLLSDDASFITGIDLVVDGGWTLALA